MWLDIANDLNCVINETYSLDINNGFSPNPGVTTTDPISLDSALSKASFAIRLSHAELLAIIFESVRCQLSFIAKIDSASSLPIPDLANRSFCAFVAVPATNASTSPNILVLVTIPVAVLAKSFHNDMPFIIKFNEDIPATLDSNLLCIPNVSPTSAICAARLFSQNSKLSPTSLFCAKPFFQTSLFINASNKLPIDLRKPLAVTTRAISGAAAIAPVSCVIAAKFLAIRIPADILLFGSTGIIYVPLIKSRIAYKSSNTVFISDCKPVICA